MGKKLNIFLILIALGIFVFFHFYNLDKRIGFGWDQESYSYQVKSIIKDHKLTLIGPRNADIKGFFLGPYFIYLLTPFFILTRLHPSALLIFVAGYNLFFFFLSLFLLSSAFDLLTATFFMLFWSINYQLVKYDVIPWNPIFIPLGVIACWYILKKIYSKNALWDWIVLGFLSGIMMNMHFSFIFIIIFASVFIFFSQFKNFYKVWKKIAAAFASFFITFIPLVLFDLRHNFLNSRLFYDFFFNKQTKYPIDLKNWLPVLNNLVKPIILLENSSLMIFFYLIILSMTFYLIKNNKNSFIKIFFKSALLIYLVFPVFFAIYGKRPSEYYFLFLMPFIYLTIIYFFTKMQGIFLLWTILFLLIIINAKPLIGTISEDMYGLFYKDKAIKELKSIIGKKDRLNISYNVPIGENNGYNYLIEYYQIKQSGDFSDPLLEIVVPPKQGNITVGGIGIKIPKEFKR